MAALCLSEIFVFVVLCSLALIRGSHCSDDERKAYIVYLRAPAETEPPTSSNHFRVLEKVVDSKFVGRSLLRSYTRSFNGFAASLTAQEREKLANHEEVVSIFPSRTFYPHTTRSWDFMGFAENVRRNPTVESDIIIGVIDSGISPESESFTDEGIGPPPKKWKGACNGGTNFTCNNKLIGARFYVSDDARDTSGHGTHTASTAAGNFVKDVSFYGLAKGAARGAVPSARIAAYKVCDEELCDSTSVLAGLDDAIADGVDIITMSVGSQDPLPLEEDVFAQGALHASMKGILAVQSAANSGDKRTVTSNAPWIFTVAAGSTDRGIITKVAIGNGTILSGKAVNSVHLNGTSFPLVYGKDVSHGCSASDAQDCLEECLDESLVKGKIVLCRTYEGIDEALRAGATGSVVALKDNLLTDISLVVPLPASGLQDRDFDLVEQYFNSTKDPKVNILTSETVKNLDAPRVAHFSSKGPNTIIPDILKPDITAPGVEILAAYSPLASPSDRPDDHRTVNYSIISGTSMSCPHVAGAAAYVKSIHPDWSASAIKSALMTTAWKMDPKKDPLAEFAYGAGYLNPVKAVHPGLVYESSTDDYIKILCSSGDKTAALAQIFQKDFTCPKGAQTTLLPKNLNYPSMTRQLKSTNGSNVVTFSEQFARIVTNVGLGNSTYKVTTSTSPDYRIVVKPDTLTFGAVHEKRSFEVSISGKAKEKMVKASLEWSDGVHRVRSPIVLYTDDF